ncbi:MAG: hypothetical protein IPH63_05420 [Flavobacteriales bacterium]|nr:hypothetical protein [Flavobacteriales bacterium]
MGPITYPRFLFVLDDFYADLEKVYRAAQEATYYEPEEYTGFRSTKVYHEPGVRAKLERLLDIRITRWDKDPADENGVFYQAFAKGKAQGNARCSFGHAVQRHRRGLPHAGSALPCGTSLWMHKRTGLCDPLRQRPHAS